MSEAKKQTKGKRGKKTIVGVGVGIGSAAIVAALLYAGKLRSQKKRPAPTALNTEATD